MSIRAERTEEAFLGIRNTIENVSQALSRVEDEYCQNDSEMFNLVDTALTNLGVTRSAKKATDLLPALLKAVSDG